jgi:hypothetical protein
MDETKLAYMNDSHSAMKSIAPSNQNSWARLVVDGRRVGAWSQELPSLHGFVASCAVPELSGGGGCCGRQQVSPLQSDMDDVYDPEDDDRNHAKESLRGAYSSGKAVSASPGEKKPRKDQKKRQDSYEDERSSDLPPAKNDAGPRKFSYTVKEHEDCVKVCVCVLVCMYVCKHTCMCVYIHRLL